LRQATNDRTKPNIVPPIRKKIERRNLYKKASTIVIIRSSKALFMVQACG